MFAGQSGDTRTVTMLVEGGSDVNARETAMGQTPLMFAAAYNRVDVVKLLLARGADIAATSKVVDLTKLSSPEEEFFRQRAQPQGGGQGGPRPPDVAGVTRQFRYNELVGTSGGFSPLHFAVRQGFFDVVKALVDAGADVNQLNPGDSRRAPTRTSRATTGWPRSTARSTCNGRPRRSTRSRRRTGSSRPPTSCS
jgi:ankyrin repeat protein